MKNILGLIISTGLIQAAFADSGNPSAKFELRFTCEESTTLANKMDSIMSRVFQLVQRQRGIAIQASNGTLGSNDRNYLNIQYTTMMNEMISLVSNARFIDSYGDMYLFFKDGIQFRTLVYSPIDRLSFPASFAIGPFELKTWGSLAIETFQLNRTPIDGGSQPYLFLNQTPITAPVIYDDTVSSNGNERSAIAVSKKINEQSWNSKVYADIQTTILDLNKLDMNGVALDFSQWRLKINDISITGTGNGNGVILLINAINNYANQTGIQARLQPNEIDSIQLYAYDGRNIEMEVADAYLNIFRGRLQSGKNLFVGSVKLRSAAPFDITAGSSILGFQGKHSVALTDATVQATNVLTQDSASDALSQLDAALAQINDHRAKIAPMLNICPPK